MGKRVQAILQSKKALEQEEDMGIPGKLYYDKPKVISMESYRKNEIPEFDPIAGKHSRPGPEELYLRETPVRLKSSHKTYNGSYKLPDTVVYTLPQRPSQDEANEYIRMRKIDGYGEGTIVARRFADSWQARWHGQWGIITRVLGHVSMMPAVAWAPYVVQWFERPAKPEEEAWAEDLIVIHCCLDKMLLEDLLEAQGIPRRDV